MEYEKISLTTNKDCGCKELVSKKDCKCSLKPTCKKIELTPNCGTSEHFAVNNYFSELVHEWEKEAARYNLGVLELDNIEYITETTENGELLTKVIFKYRKGHELITREFVCAPRGEKGEPGRDGNTGPEGPKGEKGDPGKDGNSPTMGRVTLTWVASCVEEDCYFEPSCDGNQWNLVLNLRKPDSITELGKILELINLNLVNNYVTKGSLPDFSQFEKKADNKLRLDYTGSTLSLLKNGTLEDSVVIPRQDSEYTLQIASDNILGGIKTGYYTDETSRNYPVNVDGVGRAYVKVPWTDTVSDDFNIYDWKPQIEKWLKNAVLSLEKALEDVNAQISELNKWKVNVTDDSGNIISTFELTDDQIIAAIKKGTTLSGIVLDVLEQQNSIVLKQYDNEAYFILAIDKNGSTTVISSDNIILKGNTIAKSISAEDMTLTGKVKATNAEITGDLSCSSFTLANKNNAKVSYYEDATSITLSNESDHRIIYVFTRNRETEIIPNGTSLTYSINNLEVLTKEPISLLKNKVYLLVRTNDSWRIVVLECINVIRESGVSHLEDFDYRPLQNITIYENTLNSDGGKINVKADILIWNAPNNGHWNDINENEVIIKNEYIIELLKDEESSTLLYFTNDSFVDLNVTESDGKILIQCAIQFDEIKQGVSLSDYNKVRIYNSNNLIAPEYIPYLQNDDLINALINKIKTILNEELLLGRKYTYIGLNEIQATTLPNNGLIVESGTGTVLGEVSNNEVYNISGKAYTLDYNGNLYKVKAESEALNLKAIAEEREAQPVN